VDTRLVAVDYTYYVGLSILDLLGPWPWYVFAEIAIVFAGWLVVMTLPWLPGERRHRAAARSG
jgi:uncharacterized membrane protein YwaF